MAKKKQEPKIVLERIYNVPLRKEFLKTPRWKRTKKAVKALREFIVKHMKSDNIKIGKYLNEELWKHGIKNPPHHIKVSLKKNDSGLVTAELFGKEEVKEEPKKEKTGKKEEKAEEKKEEKKEKPEKEMPKPEEKPAEKDGKK